jgi:cysteinyl-tRNA synthetase
MALKIFNTLSRSLEEFVPLDPAGRKVGMYCCGPTVYDYAHVGNWRTFVFGDLVRRYLSFRGYEVTHVMNVTDVEDKIIKGVRESGGSLREFTGKFESAFLEDLKTLNCRPPHQTPRATEHIPEIISLIEKLMARAVAYRAGDGSVYFSIEKYRQSGSQYGKLVKLNFEEMGLHSRHLVACYACLPLGITRCYSELAVSGRRTAADQIGTDINEKNLWLQITHLT